MSDPTPAGPITEFERPIPVFVAAPRRQRYWLNVLLLVLTLFTTTVVGSHMEWNFQRHYSPLAFEDNSEIPFFPIDLIARQPSRLLDGLPFSLVLMLILTAHEMGHYLYCVHYGVSATLPFFIPFPSLIGTLGAFIRIRSPIRSRQALFDIGLAGPIAGFVVASAVLLISLPRALPRIPLDGGGTPYVELNSPLIFYVAHRLLAFLGILSEPLRSSVSQLYLHPVTIAAWVGMFATSMNLLPGGQLDGGHIVYSIAPRAHRFVSRLAILALVPMAVYLWDGWLIWAILLELSSWYRPQVADWPRVSGVRLWLAGFAALMLLLTFTPVPFDGHSIKSDAPGIRDGFHSLYTWITQHFFK